MWPAQRRFSILLPPQIAKFRGVVACSPPWPNQRIMHLRQSIIVCHFWGRSVLLTANAFLPWRRRLHSSASTLSLACKTILWKVRRHGLLSLRVVSETDRSCGFSVDDLLMVKNDKCLDPVPAYFAVSIRKSFQTPKWSRGFLWQSLLEALHYGSNYIPGGGGLNTFSAAQPYCDRLESRPICVDFQNATTACRRFFS